MKQANQAAQTATYPGMQVRAVPKATRRGQAKWLHLPALAYMIVLTQIPFLLAVWYSLHSWNLLLPAQGFLFVGLSNYITTFTGDPNFWPIMGHTLELVVGAITLALVAGTALALLLNRPIWGRNVLRGLATVPFLVTPLVMALLWKNLLLSPSRTRYGRPRKLTAREPSRRFGASSFHCCGNLTR